MAMTTNNSMRVKARCLSELPHIRGDFAGSEAGCQADSAGGGIVIWWGGPLRMADGGWRMARELIGSHQPVHRVSGVR